MGIKSQPEWTELAERSHEQAEAGFSQEASQSI